MASSLFTLAEIESALPIVRSAVPPTPQYAWPRLAARTGADVFVKHENHTPIGAFKVRGGIVYMDRLRREQPQVAGIVSATRGNHGQSLAFAARRVGVAATIVVPRGNSAEKNAAMRAFGAERVSPLRGAKAVSRGSIMTTMDQFRFYAEAWGGRQRTTFQRAFGLPCRANRRPDDAEFRYSGSTPRARRASCRTACNLGARQSQA